MLESVNKTPPNPRRHSSHSPLHSCYLPPFPPRFTGKEPIDKGVPPASITLQQPKLPQHKQNARQGDLQLSRKGTNKAHGTGCSQQSTQEEFCFVWVFFLMSPFSESSKATSRELGGCHGVCTGISSPHTTCWVHRHLRAGQVQTPQTAHRNTICSERQTVLQGNCQNKNNG